MVRDRRKMSSGHLNKSRVEELIWDISFRPACHYALKEKPKQLLNDRRHKVDVLNAERIDEVISILWRHETPQLTCHMQIEVLNHESGTLFNKNWTDGPILTTDGALYSEKPLSKHQNAERQKFLFWGLKTPKAAYRGVSPVTSEPMNRFL